MTTGGVSFMTRLSELSEGGDAMQLISCGLRLVGGKILPCTEYAAGRGVAPGDRVCIVKPCKADYLCMYVLLPGP